VEHVDPYGGWLRITGREEEDSRNWKALLFIPADVARLQDKCCGGLYWPQLPGSTPSLIRTVWRDGRWCPCQQFRFERQRYQDHQRVCTGSGSDCVSLQYSTAWRGLRPSVKQDRKTRPVSDQKKIDLDLGLVLWNAVLLELVVIMILKDTATFQVLFIVSPFCAWNITTVEINSGVYLLKG